MGHGYTLLIYTYILYIYPVITRFEGGRYVYKLHRSPLCEYMINFILKLKHLPEKYMMNSVLENFTILQVQYSSPVRCSPYLSIQ